MIDNGLKLGKTYVDGYGNKHTIMDCLKSDPYPYSSDKGATFTKEGRYYLYIESYKGDLVREVEPNEVTKTPKVKDKGIEGGLGVGKTYIDFKGDKHTIISSNGNKPRPYLSDTKLGFTQEGIYEAGNRYNLVKEMEPDSFKRPIKLYKMTEPATWDSFSAVESDVAEWDGGLLLGCSYVDRTGRLHHIKAVIGTKHHPYRSDTGKIFNCKGESPESRDLDLVKRYSPKGFVRLHKETGHYGCN